MDTLDDAKLLEAVKAQTTPEERIEIVKMHEESKSAQSASTDESQMVSSEPVNASVSESTETQPSAMAGGKKKGRRATKKGGDMGAGLLTAGTLLLLQAAAKSLLGKKSGAASARSSSRQRGGEVIQSNPAPYGGSDSLVQSTLAGGSMCGAAAQAGGKRKTQRKSKSQKGGALNLSGELDSAFGGSMSGLPNIPYTQAETAMTQSAPFVVTGGVSQDGGKRKRKAQRGGACDLPMAPLPDAFNTSYGAEGAPAPVTPGTMTALHTGGKRKTQRKSQKGGMASLEEAFGTLQAGGKQRKSKSQKGGMASLEEAFATLKMEQAGGKRKQRKSKKD